MAREDANTTNQHDMATDEFETHSDYSRPGEMRYALMGHI